MALMALVLYVIAAATRTEKRAHFAAGNVQLHMIDRRKGPELTVETRCLVHIAFRYCTLGNIRRGSSRSFLPRWRLPLHSPYQQNGNGRRAHDNFRIAAEH